MHVCKMGKETNSYFRGRKIIINDLILINR